MCYKQFHGLLNCGVSSNTFNVNRGAELDINTKNIGLAKMIKLVASKMSSDKEDLQYETIFSNLSDVNSVRNEYYRMMEFKVLSVAISMSFGIFEYNRAWNIKLNTVL